MEFASIIFLEMFLPLMIGIYYLLALIRNRRAAILSQNVFLLLCSMAFYAFGGIRNLILFAAMILFNYLFGILTGRAAAAGGKRAKAVAAAGISVNLLVLAFFKFFTAAGSAAARLASGESLFSFLLTYDGTPANGVYALAMPLAISFITFRSVSYLADVCSRKTEACRDLLTFSLYMSLLCSLTQGPIMRYGELAPQLTGRVTDLEGFRKGLRRFCYGLGKKALIANTLAAATDRIWAGPDYSIIGTGTAWLGVIFYTLQIYYDFSGYSDMAVGIGGMLGMRISENFNYPYTSFSVREFWRRWHMTLSSWFRDYVYIPAGGSRRGRGRTLFNIFIVFLLTGIWHGADMSFVIWGLFFAALVIFERLLPDGLTERGPLKAAGWLYTLFAVMMGWVLFRAPCLKAAADYYVQLFSFRGSSQGFTVLNYIDFGTVSAAIAGILLCGFIQRPLRGLYERIGSKTAFICADMLVQIAVVFWSVVKITAGGYNPSIYGSF